MAKDARYHPQEQVIKERWCNMPQGDGTGPLGQGPGTGRGMGRGFGLGRGHRKIPSATGPAGYCVCPSCGHKVPHTAGQPCNQIQCPKCGNPMTRD